VKPIEIVRGIYPDAISERHDGGTRVIVTRPSGQVILLAQGTTAKQAWRLAVLEIRNALDISPPRRSD
jgi:hypothetical protein